MKIALKTAAVVAVVVLLAVWGFNLATRLDAPKVDNPFDPSEKKEC